LDLLAECGSDKELYIIVIEEAKKAMVANKLV